MRRTGLTWWIALLPNGSRLMRSPTEKVATLVPVPRTSFLSPAVSLCASVPLFKTLSSSLSLRVSLFEPMSSSLSSLSFSLSLCFCSSLYLSLFVSCCQHAPRLVPATHRRLPVLRPCMHLFIPTYVRWLRLP